MRLSAKRLMRLAGRMLVIAGVCLSFHSTLTACDTIGGCAGNALRCAGTGGASVPSNSQLGFIGDFTIECWFRAGSSSVVMGLLGKGASGGASISITTDTRSRLTVSLHGSNGEVAEIVSPSGYLDNRWHHLAVVRRGGEVDLFLDAGFAGSAPFAATDSIGNDDDLLIGAAETENGRADLVGTIDELRIWKNAVDSSLLRCREFDRLSGGEPNLVAYYPFDDSSGRTTSCDRSAFQHNATLGAGASIVASSRSVPPSLAILDTAVHLALPPTCSDSADATVRCVAIRPCGAAIRSVAFIGGDASSFLLDSAGLSILPGDTLALHVRCVLQNRNVAAQLEIVSAECPDTLFVQLSAPPRRVVGIRADRDTIVFISSKRRPTIDSISIRNSGNAKDTIDLRCDSAGAFTLISPTPIVLDSGQSKMVLVQFVAVADSTEEFGRLIAHERTCGAEVTVWLIGIDTLTSANPVQLCAESGRIRAGDTDEFALQSSMPLTLAARDSIWLRMNYDARQIALLSAEADCGTATLADSPAQGFATILVTGCSTDAGSGNAKFSRVTLRMIGLAADSELTSLTVASFIPSYDPDSEFCASTFLVTPRCDIPRIVYSRDQTTFLDLSPNPSEATSTLDFLLGESGGVSIALYDLYGRKLSQLRDAVMLSGRHRLLIDAAALHLLPGTYLLVMNAGTFHGARRMTVLR